MKRGILLFILASILFSISGCVSNNSPQIERLEVYSYQQTEESNEVIVSKVENSDFVFVKKGNIYFMKKVNDVNKDK